MTFLDGIYYGNTLKAWLYAVLILVVALVVLQLIKIIGIRYFNTLVQEADDSLRKQVANIVRKTNFLFFLVLSVYAASMVLTLPNSVSVFISRLAVIVLVLQAAIWGNSLISGVISRYLNQKTGDDEARVASITALGFLSRLVLWTIIVLLLLDNLGIDVTTLIAGLGIGGIAVALAVQNILGDLFGSLSIVLDKPFVIGDFITVDNYMGTVEHIGIKSTRIRSISGEQLVFSNSDLLKSRIRNYKRMCERRVVFFLGVTYGTPYEKLVIIPSIIQDIIETQQQTRFDRAHLKNFGSYSLEFEVVYYILESDYNLYMNVQQAINLAIFRRFEEEGIGFAYPTQTLYINKDPQEGFS